MQADNSSSSNNNRAVHTTIPTPVNITAVKTAACITEDTVDLPPMVPPHPVDSTLASLVHLATVLLAALTPASLAAHPDTVPLAVASPVQAVMAWEEEVAAATVVAMVAAAAMAVVEACVVVAVDTTMAPLTTVAPTALLVATAAPRLVALRQAVPSPPWAGSPDTAATPPRPALARV